MHDSIRDTLYISEPSRLSELKNFLLSNICVLILKPRGILLLFILKRKRLFNLRDRFLLL